MPANPQIAFPFPSQVASGQALSANPVQSDLQHIASQFNTHQHQMVDVTDLPVAALIGVPVGGVFMWPGPTSFASQFWFCNGATFGVSSWPALATACGTYHGGNASIGMLPDLQARVPVGVAPGGLASVSSFGLNEGIAVGSRGPGHHHVYVAGNQGAAVSAGGYMTNNTNYNTSGGAPKDQPAYLVMNFLIRAI